MFGEDRPPFGGDMGLHFGPLFLELRETDFGNFKPIDSTYGLLSILRFLEKSDSCNSNKFRSNFGKTRKVTFWGAKGENILSPAAVTMG